MKRAVAAAIIRRVQFYAILEKLGFVVVYFNRVKLTDVSGAVTGLRAVAKAATRRLVKAATPLSASPQVFRL